MCQAPCALRVLQQHVCRVLDESRLHSQHGTPSHSALKRVTARGSDALSASDTAHAREDAGKCGTVSQRKSSSRPQRAWADAQRGVSLAKTRLRAWPRSARSRSHHRRPQPHQPEPGPGSALRPLSRCGLETSPSLGTLVPNRVTREVLARTTCPVTAAAFSKHAWQDQLHHTGELLASHGP